MGIKGAPERQLMLPLPERVVLRNFTLYRRRREVSAQFDRGVFCLAGANGLGKSTFLSALNFAITGVVLPPAGGTRFLGADDLYQNALNYAGTYFDGRISAADHDLAEVELQMRVGRRRYTLTRGMFAPSGLRSLTIEDDDGSVDAFDDPAFDDTERHRLYQDELLSDSGLEDFSQLVFLQLLILTFDEQRRLLFWDDRVTQAALFIAFGVSAQEARTAEELLRQIDRADSLVRNLQWQATGVRKQLEALVSVAQGDGDADARTAVEHERLQQQALAAADRVSRAEDAAGDTAVRIADRSARLRAARARYDAIYADRLLSRRHARSHPVVVATLTNHLCAICGSADSEVSSRIKGQLAAGHCPLCESVLPPPSGDDDELLAELRGVGEQIVVLEGELADGEKALIRHREIVEVAEAQLRGLQRDLEGFRQENTMALARSSLQGRAVEEATEGLQSQINALLARKEEQRQRRGHAQMQLADLQEGLVEAYVRVEGAFVPRFTDLAYRFLGVPLEIDIERRGSDIRLRLALADSDRRAPDELSESQRFFVDIALRMALAQQMASAEHPACMYIDTPEGSLDIAYESRAGSMFGSFVEGQNQMLMTANINTSELLGQLAATCGPERMRLLRMTEWTYLTEVQQQAEGLFERAYASIEEKLEHGGG
jgi:DNA repair exonuclease SbcCD ATPase subunit